MPSPLRVPGGVWSTLRTTLDQEVPSQCGEGWHVLHVPGLRLQTPTTRDRPMIVAAASDPQAQRWLGWQSRQVVREGQRERLLASRPGRGRVLPQPDEHGGWRLAAVDPRGGRLAGATWCDQNTGEVGGYLAPQYRGRGLGPGLFAGAAQFAHQHLGIASVTAGTERGNAACIAALAAARFAPAPGPGTHALPDGREVLVLWFRHEAASPSRCR